MGRPLKYAPLSTILQVLMLFKRVACVVVSAAAKVKSEPIRTELDVVAHHGRVHPN
jgi:hypothetical protein